MRIFEQLNQSINQLLPILLILSHIRLVRNAGRTDRHMYTPSYRVAYSQVNMFPVFRNDYDRTIAETEHAYSKILESSQTLLTVLKKESQTLGHGQGRPL